MVKKKELFLFFLLILLALFFIYVYQYIAKTKEDIFTRIEENKIEQISYVLKNIEEDLIESNNIHTSKELVALLSQDGVREEYEHIISLLLTSNVKYAYILYKDKKNKFRFLLDASKSDKANFYQKFDVVNPKYYEIYKTKQPQIIKQHDIENLYFTYLYPITNIDNEVIGIFNIDVTTNIQEIILDLIEPLETFFVILIIFIFLLMIMTIMQTAHYFITRKKIFTDPLTKLFNRNYLKEITPMLNLQNYSVALLDLDRFKSINDTYGHKVGDYILAESSKVFKESIRDNDILIRYGGEEFLLLINSRNSDESTYKVCERIRKNINKKLFHYDNYELRVSVSIGLHKHPSMEKDLQEAIKIADQMLYIAKKDGRNNVMLYDEKSTKTISSSKNIEFVKQALHDNRIICHFQPIYDHNTKKILKYEALVRIINTDGNILYPGEFLPELKHTNIHYKLTQKILSLVFEKFKDNNFSVSININFSDLINPDIQETITKALQNNLNLASRITFEILESDEIDNIELFKEKIDLLQSLKAKVSIDDFGSGYSNFKTIIDIEANYLKIDGSLIKNIHINEKDYKVVKSIIHFAQQSGMKTVAEFVHSEDVFKKLLELEIDFMQGYYISKPLDTLIEEESLFQEES